MGAMPGLRDSGFAMALGYMVYCRSGHVDWLWGTLS